MVKKKLKDLRLADVPLLYSAAGIGIDFKLSSTTPTKGFVIN